MARKVTNYFERNGKLYARISYMDSEGKRRQKARLAESKSDIPRVVRQLEDELERGGPDLFRHSKTTLDRYLDTWLGIMKQNVGEKTYSTYEYLLRCHVRPTLGRKELQNIRRLDVQAVISSMRERGLSAKTVRETHMVLSRALKQAVEWEMLIKNPAANVELPKKTRQEMQYLSGEQAQRFLTEAMRDKWGVLFCFALKTGMRPEEYLALRWSDLDLKKKNATVQRVLIRKRKGGGFIFAEPKTPRSRRTIPLSQSLVGMLEEHKQTQPDAHRFTYNLVFASDAGTPLSMRNLERRNFKPVLKRADLPGIRLYDLRHTHATLLLLAGENPKVVSERLGHASVAFTLDTYAHVLPSMQEEATEKLEALLSAQGLH